MSNSILYYPTIEFRHEDYQWLWNAALFADKIYRIVPPGYELNEPRNIRELCSTGEIGIPLSPVPYSKEASEEFSKFMDENHRKAAALSLIEDDETEYIRIHSSKMDVKLLQDIFFKLKHIDEDENWLYASSHTVNFYMTFLANHIASHYGQEIFRGEYQKDLEGFVQILVNSRNRIAHIKSKQNRKFLNGDESVLYLHKLSLMYRIILLDLLDIPLNRYKERLSNRIETINCWWADRCDQ